MSKGQNISLSQVEIKMQTLYCIAIISWENGLEHINVYDRQCDSAQFCNILPHVTPRKKKVLLFLDRAPWHTSEESICQFNNWGIEFAFNVAW